MNQKYPLLSQINCPGDLRKLPVEMLPELAGELRQCMLEVLSENGGHLSSNFGVVELTLALHYIFDTPTDKLLWDVGHQSYVHKLLTGRQELFTRLRKRNGCCGFQSMTESKYDDFGAGHAGTAISAAEGIAVALDRQNLPGRVIAVVGDGALSCGISMEGLLNASALSPRLVVVLNDNRMSISESAGSLRSYLNILISGRVYNRWRIKTRDLLMKLLPRSIRHLQKVDAFFKSLLLPAGMFESLGFRYIGPIDGNNLPKLLRTFHGLRDYDRPLLIHVTTRKGYGYAPAEAEPERFHGIGAFDPESGQGKNRSGGETFSDAFGDGMLALAEKHPEVTAITAAMASGTGLKKFASLQKKQFFDVGIAEEHAVVFAAGQAAAGLRPVVAIYATFMQRALDCIFHDVCLQKLPVIFALDRSGAVEDGPTHHGIYDLGFLRGLPNLVIMAPWNGRELRQMLEFAYELAMPVVIRYPRGRTPELSENCNLDQALTLGKSQVLLSGSDGALWAMGAEVETALKTAELLKKEGICITVVNVRFLLPLDTQLLQQQAGKMKIFTLENHRLCGGLGSAVYEALQGGSRYGIRCFGWGEEVPFGDVNQLRYEAGLTCEQLAVTIAEDLRVVAK